MRVAENLKKFLYGRLREKRELLIIRLGKETMSVSLYNKSILIWEENIILPSGFNEHAEEFLQAVEAALRAILLQHDVEENAACIFSLNADYFYTEELRLPLLPEREQKQALAWEARQCVPWEEESYTYICAEQERSGQQVRLNLYALPLTISKGISLLAGKLYLRLHAVSAEIPAQEAVSAWFAGGEMPDLLPKRRFWQKNLALAQQYCYKAAALWLLLCMLVYAGAFAGRYLAQEKVREAQRILTQQSKWEQRYQESAAWQTELKRLQKISKKLRAQRILWSGELENLCRMIPSGCWLTLVEPGKNKAGLLQLKGNALDLQTVQDFAQSLQESGKYQRVQLVYSGSNAAVYEYVLLLQLQGAGQQMEAGAQEEQSL